MFVAETDPDKPMMLRFALPFWRWASFRRLIAEVEGGGALTEGPGLLWRYFYLRGPLLFLFDVREIFLHTTGLSSRLINPGEGTSR